MLAQQGTDVPEQEAGVDNKERAEKGSGEVDKSQFGEA